MEKLFPRGRSFSRCGLQPRVTSHLLDGLSLQGSVPHFSACASVVQRETSESSV